MEISIEKTTYVLVHRNKEIRSKVAPMCEIFIDGQTLVKPFMIIILGSPESEKQHLRHGKLIKEHLKSL